MDSKIKNNIIAHRNGLKYGMKDLHSFIIPAFGDSPFLEECIQSLMHQTVKSPILIATSTPSPYIKDIAQKYRLNIRINPEEHSGIASDWNFAFAQASTLYVTLAHQDEIYHQDYSSVIIRHVSQFDRKTVSIIFTGYRELVGNKLLKGPSFHARIKKILLLPYVLKSNMASIWVKKASLSLGTPICCSSVTYHKDFLQGFTFSDRYKVALDWHAWRTLAAQDGYFCYINKKLISHRIHPGTETFRQIQSGLRYEEELDIFTSIWGKTMAKFLMKLYVYGHRINSKSA
ncbi:MAG TPA: glycosyltransferase family A protein [Saprospiraceae bacterium]|nr:glycosyltransferase family A protein [Saprospiraceae bacterium]